MQKKKTVGNKALLAVSFVIAAIMWLAVTVFLNPVGTRSISGIAVNVSEGAAMLDSMGLSIVGSSIPEIKVEVSGNRIDLSTLTSEDFTVAPKFSGISKAGAYTLELTAVANKANVEVLSVSPQNIDITVARIETATLPLNYRVLGDVPDGYFLEEVSVADESVKISGPSDTVSKIVSATVIINEPRNGTESLPISFLDASGKEVNADSLEKSISTTETTVTLFKTKTVTLTAQLTDVPQGIESGRVTLSVTPGTLTLKGPETVINGMGDIYSVTQISLSTISESEIREIELRLPEGVQAVDGTATADVDIRVSDSMVIRYLDVRDFVLSDYLQDFDVTVETGRLRNVSIIGPAEIVDAITAQDIVATVVYDTSDIPQKGRYTMKVEISSPSYSGFWVYGDYEVNVKVG